MPAQSNPCPRCGAPLARDAAFCGTCGASVADQDERSEAAPLSTRDAATSLGPGWGGTDPRLGTSIAGYTIVGRLGRGGMAIVYIAQDERLGRSVALKVMDSTLSEDAAYRQRFAKEATNAGSLEHPNIVPVYDAGETGDGTLYIAMRYIAGGDLGSMLRAEGRLAPGRAVALLAQVADALDFAHSRGFVHRDVKPGNVLLDRGGSVEHAYLSDFGVMKRLDGSTGLTLTGQFLGTIDYIAPEQISGGAVTPAADIYSLGCVLYECLVGRPPFASQNPVAVLDAHRKQAAPSASAFAPDLAPQMDGVIVRAMAKHPEDRFASASAMLGAARSALAGVGPTLAVPRPAAPPSAPAPFEAAPTSAGQYWAGPGGPSGGERGRSRAWLIAAIVGLVCVAGGATAVALVTLHRPAHVASAPNGSTTPVSPTVSVSTTAAPSQSAPTTTPPTSEGPTVSPSPTKKELAVGVINAWMAAVVAHDCPTMWEIWGQSTGNSSESDWCDNFHTTTGYWKPGEILSVVPGSGSTAIVQFHLFPRDLCPAEYDSESYKEWLIDLVSGTVVKQLKGNWVPPGQGGCP